MVFLNANALTWMIQGRGGAGYWRCCAGIRLWCLVGITNATAESLNRLARLSAVFAGQAPQVEAVAFLLGRGGAFLIRARGDQRGRPRSMTSQPAVSFPDSRMPGPA
jgi:hypothetical protein